MSSWELELIDRMTGPARRMGASVASVARELKAVERVTAAVERAQGRAAAAVARLTTRLRAMLRLDKAKGPRARDERGRFLKGGGAGFGVGELVSGLRSIANSSVGNFLADGAMKLLGAAASLTMAGAQFVAKMSAFKEQTLFAYKYITGSANAAAGLFRDADALARATGGKTTLVAESLRELRAGGFADAEAKAVTAAIADIRALNPAADVTAISQQLAQMRGAGRVLMEDLKPILNAGVNDDVFYQVLREMTGQKDQAALKKLMESGKVSAETGQAAILETVRRMGGGGALGSVAAERARSTVTGQVEAIEGSLERLFLNLETGPASTAIVGVLSQVRGALDPTTEVGARLVAVITSVASFGTDVFGRVMGGGNLSAALSGVLRVVEAVLPPLKALVGGVLSGMGEAFGDAAGVVGKLFAALDLAKGQDFVDLMASIGKGVGYVLGIAVPVAGALVGVVAAVGAATSGILYGASYLVVRLVGLVGSAAGSVWDAGKSLVDGLWGGITSAWGSMLSGFRSLVALLPEGVRKVLGIASPSRVMAELGGYAGAGFALGVEGQEGRAQGAMAALVAAPDLPRLGPPGGFGPGGGAGLGARGGSGPVSVSVVVHVAYAPAAGQPAPGPDELADRIGDVVGERLEDFELEMGLLGAPA
ncbi:MAG TPA: tape measure protein [Polyangiaceae bacterium]|nr:tape measure protein [Polyangiaceae bacterium]